MFNVCVLTGPVLTEPKLTSFEGHPDTMFYIGISLGPYKAGVIKVCCGHRLAPVAEEYIHRGDRVSVVGIIGRYVYEDDKLKGPHELVLVAQDFELVRSDSPVRKQDPSWKPNQMEVETLQGGYIYGTAYHQEESILVGTTDQAEPETEPSPTAIAPGRPETLAGVPQVWKEEIHQLDLRQGLHFEEPGPSTIQT